MSPVSSAHAAQTLLIVDDEPELRALLNEYFSGHGFRVQLAADAAQARAHLADGKPPSLVLLDVNMPGENGLSLARWLRQSWPRVGLIMLTTASDTVDRIVGLELGADDYLPKPFELRELLARVRSVLRRAEPPATTELAVTPAGAAPEATAVGQSAAAAVAASSATALTSRSAADAPSEPRSRQVMFGTCRLDLDQRRLFDGQGEELPLTAAEFDLLALFARHPNRPLSRDQIMEQAHHRGWDVFDRSIDLRIMRLRRKIEANPDKPEILKTVRNVGYVFTPR